MDEEKDLSMGQACENPGIYWEKQVNCRCGLHALNNMLGGPVFAYDDIDPSNLVGNYSITELDDAVYEKFHQSLVMIFSGKWVPRETDRFEDIFDYYRRVAREAWMFMTPYWSFLCVRRDHFFAIRRSPWDHHTFYYIDSTKNEMYMFQKKELMCLGRLLKGCDVYVIE